MEPRINALEKGRGAFAALYAVGAYLKKSIIEKELQDLVYFRVSQINGCAYCLDMHAKDLRATGETEQRLYLLNAWREAPFYTSRERAALAWAEAVTMLNDNEVSDEVFKNVCTEFSEEEIIDLTLAITTINTYNRFNIAFRTPAGDYVVGMHG